MDSNNNAVATVSEVPAYNDFLENDGDSMQSDLEDVQSEDSDTDSDDDSTVGKKIYVPVGKITTSSSKSKGKKKEQGENTKEMGKGKGKEKEQEQTKPQQKGKEREKGKDKQVVNTKALVKEGKKEMRTKQVNITGSNSGEASTVDPQLLAIAIQALQASGFQLPNKSGVGQKHRADNAGESSKPSKRPRKK